MEDCSISVIYRGYNFKIVVLALSFKIIKELSLDVGMLFIIIIQKHLKFDFLKKL